MANKDAIYCLQFNDLTMRKDIGTVDQAIHTVSAAFAGEDSLNAHYNKLSIRIYCVDLASIQSFLSPQFKLKHIHQTIECLRLTSDEILTQCDQIKAETIDLELLGDQNEFLKVIESFPFIQKIQLSHSDVIPVTYETLDRASAIKILSTKKTDSLKIKITELQHDHTKKIVTDYKHLKINATFNHVDISRSNAGLKQGMANIYFSHLTQEEVKELIPCLREQSLEWTLCFDDLTQSQARAVFKKSDIAQEEINITRVKPLSELFIGCHAESELAAFSARGIEYTLELNERSFVPWRSIAVVSMLSAVQIATGAALIATGFGASVGIGLITEGAADIVTAVRAYKNRHFTWSDYFKQKAVSLVISATCMGWQAIKDAGKGIKNLVVGVGEEVLEQAGAQVVANGRTIGQTLVQSGCELNTLAAKQIAVAVTEGAAREGLNQLADTVSDFCFQRYRSNILKSVHDKVSNRFCDSPINQIIRKMHALHVLAGKGSFTFQDLLQHTIMDIVDPKSSYWKRQWESVGRPLCVGILSAQQYLSAPISIAARLVGFLNGSNNIYYVVDHFHQELSEKLNNINKEMLSMSQLLQTFCSFKEDIAIGIVALLKEQGLLDQDENIIHVNFKSISFGAYHQHQDTTIAFLTRLYSEITKTDIHHTTAFIARVMTDHIINTAESQLILPATSYLAGYTVNSISRSVQNAFIKRQLRKETQAMRKEIATLIDQQDATAEESNTLNTLFFQHMENQTLLHGGSMTTTDQIFHTARLYCTAYSQCEMIYFAQRASLNTMKNEYSAKVSVPITQYAEDVKNGKPANLADMFVMAANNGIGIKIVDDPYQITAIDKTSNAEIIVYTRGDIDSSGTVGTGHWSLMDKEGQMIEIPSQDDDCGYAIFSHLTNKSIKQLRDETALAITKDAKHFENVIQAQTWLVRYDSSVANDALLNGGKRRVLELKEPGLAIINDVCNATNAVYHQHYKHIGGLERIDFKKQRGVPFKFKAAVGVYRNTKTGNIIIAFEGSSGVFSWMTDNPPLLAGGQPVCVENCMDRLDHFMTEIKNEYPYAQITLTGHSKGALIASICSDRYKLPAIVFDNPGTRLHQYSFDQVISIQSTPNVVNSSWVPSLVDMRLRMFGYDLKKGHVIHLYNDSSPSQKHTRWIEWLDENCLPKDKHLASHSMDYIERLIKYNSKNQKRILKELNAHHDASPSLCAMM